MLFGGNLPQKSLFNISLVQESGRLIHTEAHLPTQAGMDEETQNILLLHAN